MAVAEKPVSKSVNVVLQIGEKNENVSLGPVNPNATLNNSAIWATKNAIAPILEGDAIKVTKTQKSELYEEE